MPASDDAQALTPAQPSMSASSRPLTLITGASSGIGEVFAERLAHAGRDLLLVARRENQLRETVERLAAQAGVNADILPADLSTHDGVLSLERRIAELGRLDMLVNAAGYAARGRVAELDPDALDAMLAVNIVALSRLSHAALARMVEAKSGTIINVSSGTAVMQIPGNAGYGSSKSYVSAFTRHMHLEAQGSGVRVQLLVPGVIATPFHAVAGSDLARFPPERVMSAEDLVAASLRGLELGEAVCIPSLPEISDWDSYVAAEARLAQNVSRNVPAARYRS